jgi:hypothetical protein
MRASRDAGATQSAPEGEGGSSSTDRGGTVERPDQPSSTALDRGDSPRDGSASADTGGGLTLEDIERELMADSDDEGGGEAGDRQASAEGGTVRQQQADGLSDYERERLETIRRNNQVLRDLGLDEDPLIPQRPPPAPRQPRQPRAPDGPRRQSSRLRGVSRPVYNEDAPSTVTFDQQTRSSIKSALAAETLQGADLELASFTSASQLPRDSVTSTGVRGDAEELDEYSGSQNILVSLRVRNFFVRAGLAYSPALLWQWIAHVPGIDITVLLFRGEVIGAALGFYSATEHMYLTHATATHRSLRAGVGVGLFLRKQQLRLLAQRIDPTRGPVEVVSLSANADTSSPGAVEFQRHVFTQKAWL